MKETINIKKEDLWKYSTFILLAILVIGAFVFFGLRDETGNTVAPSNIAGENQRVDVDVGNSPILGDENAEVTIVEFMDYYCGYCARHSTQTLPSIKKDYIDTGKVRYVIKHFDRGAGTDAAESALCVREQLGNEGYFKMHDKIFSNQNQMSQDNFKIWALEIGVDQSKFDSCLKSGKFKEVIAQETNEGRSAGVTGTPGFLINGKLIIGAQPYNVFKQAIDAEI